MKKVKVFLKTEVDLVQKVGVYAYTLYDYKDQLTVVAPFKNGIKTMVHADCMAVVNALARLATTINGNEVDTLEVVTDSKNVATLLLEGKRQKHCEAAAAYWWNVLKKEFPKLERIEIIKSDRHGTGPADNVNVLKKLKDMAGIELTKMKQLSV